jgi:hypothetical protein
MIFYYVNQDDQKFYDALSARNMLNLSKGKFQRLKKLLNLKYTELRNKHLLKEEAIFEMMEYLLCEKINSIKNELSANKQITRFHKE